MASYTSVNNIFSQLRKQDNHRYDALLRSQFSWNWSYKQGLLRTRRSIDYNFLGPLSFRSFVLAFWLANSHCWAWSRWKICGLRVYWPVRVMGQSYVFSTHPYDYSAQYIQSCSMLFSRMWPLNGSESVEYLFLSPLVSLVLTNVPLKLISQKIGVLFRYRLSLEETCFHWLSDKTSTDIPPRRNVQTGENVMCLRSIWLPLRLVLRLDWASWLVIGIGGEDRVDW